MTALAVLLAAVTCVTGDVSVDTPYFDAGWTRVKTVFSAERTKNIYGCPPKGCEPLSSYSNGLLVARNRYPKGVEDCAIVGGIALSMFVDRYAVTGEEKLKGEARWVAEGLRNLVFNHAYPGYVTRGLHPADGQSIGALSSRDQVTHLVHGLWRYAKSPLANADDRALAAKTVAAVADWMIRTVTRENDWNFGQADGKPDPRGVCKMREVRPHEAARLASVYAAAWDLSGKPCYRVALDEVLPEALEGSEGLEKMSANDLKYGVPDYALLQMSSSLEVLRGVKCEAVKRIDAILLSVARLAARRDAEGVAYYPWLCGAAERPLLQLMATGFVFSDAAKEKLCKSLAEVPFEKAGSTRIVELSAAYWKWRLSGKAA